MSGNTESCPSPALTQLSAVSVMTGTERDCSLETLHTPRRHHHHRHHHRRRHHHRSHLFVMNEVFVIDTTISSAFSSRPVNTVAKKQWPSLFDESRS